MPEKPAGAPVASKDRDDPPDPRGDAGFAYKGFEFRKGGIIRDAEGEFPLTNGVMRTHDTVVLTVSDGEASLTDSADLTGLVALYRDGQWWTYSHTPNPSRSKTEKVAKRRFRSRFLEAKSNCIHGYALGYGYLSSEAEFFLADGTYFSRYQAFRIERPEGVYARNIANVVSFRSSSGELTLYYCGPTRIYMVSVTQHQPRPGESRDVTVPRHRRARVSSRGRIALED
jgi:hypothetical protein